VDKSTNQVNWHKYWKEYKIINDLQFCQTLKFHSLKNNLNLVLAIQSGHSRVLTENELFKRSYRFEPRESANANAAASS
jgi:hypothetical protein